MIISMIATPLTPRFDAWLHPARPLSRRGLWLVFGLVALVGVVTGGVFTAVGAWPVAGFVGVDVVVLAVALITAARTRQIDERVVLTDRRLAVFHYESGRMRWRRCFEPTWARVAVERVDGVGSRLVVSTHGHGVAIGGYLTEAEQRELARAIDGALRRWRDPGRQWADGAVHREWGEKHHRPAQEAGG